MQQPLQVHASCVAIHSKGVLLFGEPGSGKSDLALRLIDRGAVLVSDDRVNLRKEGEHLIAKAPENIAGLMEIRGLGIMRLTMESDVPVCLAVQLVDRRVVDRLPVAETFECLGMHIPQIRLSPFDASAPIRIEMALASLQDKNMMRAGGLKECESGDV
ncbi:MAG TPA: HPr kinase/phosphatase C-terminal domain-containing protein [Rickettsiales bacterium]|nr:HPr kinase/phosphatase C-terminal domain-containing protein [Rickettsiales bacterium]